ncbi:MAG: hypothetical protein HND52_01955 [Ignavibacteriae bacterium]|jgi:hypothetical protein|nr:hypothetical protein [Ignavibacteriota bacterium]NOG96715.1 hypothetical protein [Ignavibacteriota bacterium]
MKHKILVLLLITSSICFGQFREELERPKDVRGGITNDAPPSLMLGFFNPENFTMNHAFNLSYTAFGGHGVSLGVYTNSMIYKFNEDLDIQVDASLVTSPYNTFGNNFSDQISGFYLSRAQLNYRPTENSNISIQFRQIPYGYGNPYGYSNYRNSYYGRSFWEY